MPKPAGLPQACLRRQAASRDRGARRIGSTAKTATRGRRQSGSGGRLAGPGGRRASARLIGACMLGEVPVVAHLPLRQQCAGGALGSAHLRGDEARPWHDRAQIRMRTWTTLSGAVHVGRLPDAPAGSSPPKNPKNLNPALAAVPSCQTQRLAGPVRCTRFGLAGTAAQPVKEIRSPARAHHCPKAAEGVLGVGDRTLGRRTQEKHTRLCSWRGPLKPDISFVCCRRKKV